MRKSCSTFHPVVRVATALVVAASIDATANAQAPKWAEKMDVIDIDSLLVLIHSIDRNGSLSSDEIGATTDQVASLMAIVKQYREAHHSAFLEMAEKLETVESPEKKEAIKLAFEAQTKELMNKSLWKIDSVILPHQIERLKQLTMLSRLRLFFDADFFDCLKSLAKMIELTDQERKESIESIDVIEDEYWKEVEKLNERFKRRAIEAFPRRGREQIEEIVGEIPFKAKR